MKRIISCLLGGALVALSGCETITHVMTYESPTNYTMEDSERIFNGLPTADNVYDNAIAVRGAVTDDVVFDEKSKVYNFDTGRSPFRTYNLPLNATSIRIEISSKIGQSVFAPCVALLSKDRRIIKKFESSSFEYRPLGDVASDNLRFRFNLNNFSAGDHAVAYMVIYTDDAALKSTTKIIHPAKLFAMSHHTEVPNIEDPIIPHSHLGELTVDISLNAEESSSFSDLWDSLKGPIWGGETHSYISDDDDGEINPKSSRNSSITLDDGKAVIVNPKEEDVAKSSNSANKTVVKETEKKAVTAKPAGSMLKQTEDMYNSMIVAAVKAGDVSKAMQLAAEAESAGSATANSTLNSAIKNYHR